MSTKTTPASSTISGLAPIPSNLVTEVLQFEIPTAYGRQNYKIRPIDFLHRKFISGIERVDNTSDLEKPISHAQQLELDKKASQAELQQWVNSLQNYRRKDELLAVGDINNLSNLLNEKLNKDGSISQAQVQGLAEALLAKADKNHRHALSEATDWEGFSTALRESLQTRPTVPEVEHMLEVAISKIDFGQLPYAVIWVPEKSDW